MALDGRLWSSVIVVEKSFMTSCSCFGIPCRNEKALLCCSFAVVVLFILDDVIAMPWNSHPIEENAHGTSAESAAALSIVLGRVGTSICEKGRHPSSNGTR